MSLWCEVSKSKLKENIAELKKRSGKEVIAVVKGNAYGLGLKKVSKIIENDVYMYGVSSLKEADEIETSKDILIMTPVCDIPSKPVKNYIYTIDSKDDLKKINKSEAYRVHIYINTGMNRLGVSPNEVDALIIDIFENHKNISIEGIYTHLHKAADIEYSKEQVNCLKMLYNRYKDRIKHFHCLNSKGVLNKELVEAAGFTDLVRTGNVLYGFIGNNSGFKRVFQVKAKVIKKYEVKKGSTVGYGAKSIVNKDTIVGVLSCGNIDKIGYKRDGKPLIIKDCLRVIKNSIKKQSYIKYKNVNLYEVCECNMNCALIDVTNYDINEEMIVDLNLSSIQADSSIEKKYID